MKLFIVVADTYEDDYGAAIELFGVYSTKEKALERYEEVMKNRFIPGKEYCIHEILLDKDCEIYLGGYVE